MLLGICLKPQLTLFAFYSMKGDEEAIIQRQFVLDCVGPEIRNIWNENDEAAFQLEMLRGSHICTLPYAMGIHAFERALKIHPLSKHHYFLLLVFCQMKRRALRI